MEIEGCLSWSNMLGWKIRGDVLQLIDFRKGLVGRKLAGKYVLQRPIGAGGMGSVYRAVQQGTEARVAVKILSRDTPDLRTASRFRQEAEMTARA